MNKFYMDFRKAFVSQQTITKILRRYGIDGHGDEMDYRFLDSDESPRVKCD